MMTRNRIAALAMMLAGLSGCNRQADVSGTVTFDGKPLVFGTVQVEGPDGAIKQGNIDTNGTYSISGVTTGEVRVSVNSPNPKSSALVPIRGEGRVPDQPGWFAIPDRFGSVETSGLSYTLKGGANAVNIEMAK